MSTAQRFIIVTILNLALVPCSFTSESIQSFRVCINNKASNDELVAHNVFTYGWKDSSVQRLSLTPCESSQWCSTLEIPHTVQEPVFVRFSARVPNDTRLTIAATHNTGTTLVTQCFLNNKTDIVRLRE